MVDKRFQFTSSKSSYQILAGDHKNTNYTYWSSLCTGYLCFFTYLCKPNTKHREWSIVKALFFPDLGYDPAILNTEEEWNFIKDGKVGEGELNSYWIGGSTDIDTSAGSGLYYHEYLTTATGRLIRAFHILNLKLD